MKYRESARILACSRIATDIFSITLATDQIAAATVPGQFVSVYTQDSASLLPRPISVCEADEKSGALRLVFRVVGKGTLEFSRRKEGERLDIVGPLGNGFPLDASVDAEKVFVIGGGIGIPPMLELARRLSAGKAGVTAVLGYRDELFLRDDFPCETIVATEDGSCGTKGTVLDAIREHGIAADVIYACGPAPMLRALKQYAMESGTQCWLSMEEKMACGIGACLSCVCRSVQVDEHSQVKNRRICTEGPVFLSTDIEL